MYGGGAIVEQAVLEVGFAVGLHLYHELPSVGSLAGDVHRSLLIQYVGGKAVRGEILDADNVLFKDVFEEHNQQIGIVEEHPLEGPVVGKVRVGGVHDSVRYADFFFFVKPGINRIAIQDFFVSHQILWPDTIGVILFHACNSIVRNPGIQKFAANVNN